MSEHNEQVCKNCEHYYAPIPGYNAGKCRLTSEVVSAANSCPLWGGRKRNAPTGSKAFDVEAGAQKVLDRGGDISIVNVQQYLKCRYIEAAEVVEYLRINGKIKEK